MNLQDKLDELTEGWTYNHYNILGVYNNAPKIINSFDDLLITKLIHIFKIEHDASLEYKPLTVSGHRIAKWGNKSTVIVDNKTVYASNVYLLAYRFYCPGLNKYYDTKDQVLSDISLIKNNIKPTTLPKRVTKKQPSRLTPIDNVSDIRHNTYFSSNQPEETPDVIVKGDKKTGRTYICVHVNADIDELRISGAIELPSLDCRICNEENIICKHYILKPEEYEINTVSNGMSETCCKYCDLVLYQTQLEQPDFVKGNYVLEEEENASFIRKRIRVIISSISNSLITFNKKINIDELIGIIESRISTVVLHEMNKKVFNGSEYQQNNYKKVYLIFVVMSALLKLHLYKPDDIIINPKIKALKTDNLLINLIKGYIYSTSLSTPSSIISYVNNSSNDINYVYNYISLLLPDIHFTQYRDIDDGIKGIEIHPYFTYICYLDKEQPKDVLLRIKKDETLVEVYKKRIDEMYTILDKRHNIKRYKPFNNNIKTLKIKPKSNHLLNETEPYSVTETITHQDLLDTIPVFPMKRVNAEVNIEHGSYEWTELLYRLRLNANGSTLPLMYDIEPFIVKCIKLTNNRPTVQKFLSLQGLPSSIKRWYDDVYSTNNNKKTTDITTKQFNVDYESEPETTDGTLFEDNVTDIESEPEVDED